MLGPSLECLCHANELSLDPAPLSPVNAAREQTRKFIGCCVCAFPGTQWVNPLNAVCSEETAVKYFGKAPGNLNWRVERLEDKILTHEFR